MALIICSECGKEYSDRASVCPNCACPTPGANCAEQSTDQTTGKSRFPFGLIFFVVILVALSVVIFKHIQREHLYNSGLEAMYMGDYSTARNCLEELYYKDSEIVLNDVAFLEELEGVVKEDIAYNFDGEYMLNSAENRLKKLRKYKAEEFYTDGLNQAVDQYIEGLERIAGAIDYEVASSIQFELLAGKYYCDSVIVSLHDNLGFMENSSKYDELYPDIISQEAAMLDAYKELEEKGHIATRNGEFWYNQVRLYLRNDTEYSFDQTYIFNFYNYNGSKLLDTVTLDVLGVEPYSDYTVRIDVPQSAANGYSVEYSYLYLDVDIPD